MDFGYEEFSLNFLCCGYIYSVMYLIYIIRDVCVNCFISF